MKLVRYLKRNVCVLFLLSSDVTLLEINAAAHEDVVDGGVAPKELSFKLLQKAIGTKGSKLGIL